MSTRIATATYQDAIEGADDDATPDTPAISEAATAAGKSRETIEADLAAARAIRHAKRIVAEDATMQARIDQAKAAVAAAETARAELAERHAREMADATATLDDAMATVNREQDGRQEQLGRARSVLAAGMKWAD